MKLTTREIFAVLMFFGGLLIFFFYSSVMQHPRLVIEPDARDIFRALGVGTGLMLMLAGPVSSKLPPGRIGLAVGIAAGTVYSLAIVSCGYFLDHGQWGLAGVFLVLGILAIGSLVRYSQSATL